MQSQSISIRGARTHNLKNINLSIPRDKLTVITGLSGSGKSSLAFDTLYAEGRRRYVESLSTYARQFLAVMDKPDVDHIEGLSPAISIEQKSTSHNPRSTTGTVTEIYDYLRLLYARVGQPRCPQHGIALEAQTISQMTDQILALPANTKILLLAPIVQSRKGEHLKQLETLRSQGFIRARINGEIIELDALPKLNAKQKHNIDIVVDRLKIDPSYQSRIADSLETTLNLANGVAKIAFLDGKEDLVFSAKFSCFQCGYSLSELEPKLFSFNSPAGACKACDGLGIKQYIDPKYDGNMDDIIRRYQETDSQYMRDKLARYIKQQECPACAGSRLNIAANNVFVDDLKLSQITAMSIAAAYTFFDSLTLTGWRATVASKILKEIKTRLMFLINVGLEYLTLNRSADTLSGGEAQRIRLASQIGAGLVGVMYVLDEPSIGLHQRDNARLIDTLITLRDLGNTVIVVEHDEDTILQADHVLDIGPGAGVHGGEVVAAGTPAQIKANKNSLTGKYLSGKECIAIPTTRNHIDDNKLLTINNARENNLRGVTVSFPIGLMTCVTGVSGSGKSTLINDTLYPLAAKKLNGAQILQVGEHDSIVGLKHLDKVVDIAQSPIGRTPRSNPATYTGLFTEIRDLFAATPEARARGYKVGRFSFNVKGGRCEACCGDGLLKVEMHFLPDVYVACDICHGKRYNRETLEVTYKGKNIHDVLSMTVEEAAIFYKAIPTIAKKLNTLIDVGLGYVQLGQSATTLSGGEAQRIKLAKELARRDTGNTLYILDEPTTGLHFHDVKRLLAVLQRLRDHGNTIIIVEHNLDVIKTADWIIDLGPEGGINGGTVVATGTPEQIAKVKASHTGRFLKPVLAKKSTVCN